MRPLALVLAFALPAQDGIKRLELAPEEFKQLVVTHAKTGRAVEQAEVLYLPRVDALFARTHDPVRFAETAADPEALLRLYGKSTLTDASGIATISRIELYEGLLVARKDALFGLTIDEPERSPAIALRPDLAVRVKTLDAHGRPCGGVTIAVAEPSRASRMPRYTRIGRTAEGSGELLIPHLQRFAEGGPLGVTVFEAGVSPEIVRVDLTRLSESPLELRLPPCGSLCVDWRDRDGRPWPHSREFEIWFAEWLLQPEDRQRFCLVRPRTSAHESRFVFPYFALGQRLRFTGAQDGFWSEFQEIDGPKREGEIVPITIRPAANARPLRALVLDAENKPVRAQRLHFNVLTDEDSVAKTCLYCSHPPEVGQWAWTDDEGQLRLYVPASVCGIKQDRAVLRLERDGQLTPRLAFLDPRGMSLGQATVLGTVVLKEMPLLARVVFDTKPWQPQSANLIRIERFVGGEWIEEKRVTSTLARAPWLYEVHGEVRDARLNLVLQHKGTPIALPFERGKTVRVSSDD